MDKLSFNQFNPNNIRPIAIRHRLAMADVVLAFASLDTNLSNWMVEAFQMRSDRAALLLQNMSISTKYQKLMKLFDHESDTAMVKFLRIARGQLEGHTEVRNMICHAECIGILREARNVIAFVPLNYIPGAPDMLRIELRSIEKIQAATHWAHEQTTLVTDAWTGINKP